jgi:hypothetical protein
MTQGTNGKQEEAGGGRGRDDDRGNGNNEMKRKGFISLQYDKQGPRDRLQHQA